MSILKTMEDSASKVHLKQSHWIGWIFVLMSIGLFYLPELKPDLRTQQNFWVLYAVSGMFGFFGLLAALYRLEINLDLIQRRYQITKGFWPNPKKTKGVFDDFQGIFLTKVWRSSGSKNNNSKRLHWQVGLKLKSEKRPIPLYESQSEVEARKEFEGRAQQLKLKAVDTTGKQTQEYQWDELDTSVLQKLQQTQYQKINLAEPPRRLSYSASGQGVTYQTPQHGFTKASVIGILFGLPFFLMGSACTFIGLGLHKLFGLQIQITGSLGIALGMGVIFMLVGGSIIKFSIDYAFTHYVFGFSRNEFAYTVFKYNRKSSENRFRVSEIEDFNLRESTRSQRRSGIKIGNVSVHKYEKFRNPELFLRTNTKVQKFQDLSPDVSVFLKNAFYQILDNDADAHHSATDNFKNIA